MLVDVLTPLLSGDITVLSSATLGILAAILVIQWLRPRDGILTINAYPSDFFYKKAHAEFISDARKLLVEGREKFRGPFRIITTLGSRIILPPEYAEWVKSCKELDHQTLVASEFFAGYPGFEGVTSVTDPNKLMIDVARNKLAQSGQCEIMHDELIDALDETCGDDREWHPINLSKDITTLISRMSSSIFVGPELSRNPKWQDLTVTYTTNVFFATRVLRSYPSFLRPLIHWFLPECRKCREQVRLARNLLLDVLHSRGKEKKAALRDGYELRKYEDTIGWMAEMAESRGVKFDPVAAQLAFAMSALHTTTELLKQAIVDICARGGAGLVEEIREEVERAIADGGWSTKGLAGMKLVDSVVKETQRLKPGSLVNLERVALLPVTLPSGLTLPKGTHIAVDSSIMWSSTAYPSPATYDPHRFLRLREEGGKKATSAALVSTSQEHMAFGMGKPICPGRFLAANEIKIALAEILSRYDVRLKEGGSEVVEVGFEMLQLAGEGVVEVRRRMG